MSVIFSLLLLGCSEGNSKIVIHPTPENIIPESELAYIIDDVERDTSEIPLAFRKTVSRLRNATIKLEIGRNEGDTNYIFGGISGIVQDREGNILVLDRSNYHVKVFDEGGNFLYKFSQKGEGPEELLHPQSMRLLNENATAVSDRRGRIKLFKKTAGEYTFERQLKTTGTPEDFCFQNDKIIYTSANQETDTYLHIMDMQGSAIVDFGELYKDEHKMPQYSLSKAIIVCNSNPETISGAFINFPYERSYTEEGKLEWVSEIGNFRPMHLVFNTETRGLRYSTEKAYEIIANLESIDTNYSLLQVWSMKKNNEGIVSIKTYILNLSTGEGVFVGTQLPYIFHANNDNLLGIEKEPFPKVLVLKW